MDFFPQEIGTKSFRYILSDKNFEQFAVNNEKKKIQRKPTLHSNREKLHRAFLYIIMLRRDPGIPANKAMAFYLADSTKKPKRMTDNISNSNIKQ